MPESEQDEIIGFEWGKKKSLGGKKKDVQFYESFTYDGVKYSLYDTVYMYNETEPEPFVGILIKIWENPDKVKKVKLLWFFRPCEISNYIQTEQFLENELLLAGGEGEGLTNINPLEAIAGKCNVVCTSKDARNREPSDIMLQTADFVFHRIFDVGHYMILDKFDEKVAGIDVKILFDRMHNQECRIIPKLDSDRKSFEGNAVSVDHINNKVCDVAKTTTVISKTSSFGEKKSKNDFILDEVRKLDGKDGDSKQRVITKTMASEKSLLRNELMLNEFGDGSKNNGLGNIHDNNMDLKSKEANSYNNGQVVEVLVDQARSKEKGKAYDDVGASFDKPFKKAKVDGYEKVLGNKESMVELHSDTRGGTKIVPHASKDEQDDKKTVEDKRNGGTEVMSRNKAPNIEVEVKPYKRKRDLLAHDCDSKETKLEEKHTKVSNEKLSEPSPKQALNQGCKLESDSRRSYVDKSKWFKLFILQSSPHRGSNFVLVGFYFLFMENDGFMQNCPMYQPWDERLQFEHEQGRLVLLQNLDPTYSASEVEEIIRKAFNQSCSAKMIQHTAFSSPYIGQAFVIFRTRQAAQTVVKELDEGCFLLPSGRLLVGCIVAPRLPAKQSTFCGHLVIEKLKQKMPREMKEAISTSHCSQPNTIEYDMALEWCILRERQDQEKKVLHKQQENDLRSLKAQLRNFKAAPKPK